MANGEQFFPEQAMDRMEALKSYTIGCAKAVFDEQRTRRSQSRRGQARPPTWWFLMPTS